MLIGAMLVRNESGRYLERVLEQMVGVCDRLVILDDASTDKTPDICLKIGVKCPQGVRVIHSRESLWGINELEQRKRLWEAATFGAVPGDWILCLDADETITNIHLLPELINFVKNSLSDAEGIAFKLYDMWDETHYRDDDSWNAHTRDWVMCVKYDPNKEYIWRDTPLHCGRFPINAHGDIVAGHSGMAIQHWGWSRAPDREAKYKRYMEADPEGKSGNLAQYQSIMDPNPTLKEFIL